MLPKKNTAKKLVYLLLCLTSWTLVPLEPIEQREPDLLTWVDPMIGTGGHGHTYPGATTPFGMIQLSPSTDVKGWDWYGGYHYSDTVLKGFAHTHTSGTGLAGLGDILLMPMTGEGTVHAGTDADPDRGFRSRFSHDREEASPGYYRVHLDDHDIDVELTATTRTGFHRYTFREGGRGHVVIDPTHVIGIGKHEYVTLSDYLLDTEVEILSDTEVRGFKHTNGSAGDRRVYFYARFSKPFRQGRVAVEDVLTQRRQAAGYNTKALLSFAMEADEELVVQVGLSFVSYAGARKNFAAEAEGRSFDEALFRARQVWTDHLSKIEVTGGTDRQKRIFYTAFYHALLGPVIINDVDGRYYVEGQVYQDTNNQYSSFSTWDTFRAQHPLLALLFPERTRQIVHALISRHSVAGVDIPVWELAGFDNMIMTGYTPVSVIYDAIVKGVPGIDEEAAYAAMKSVALNEEKGSVFAKGSIVRQLKEHGYVTAELVQSVTHTMEYAYQDWCIAQMAERLGKEEDLDYFRKRAESYKHLFRPETGYMWPRMPDGNWVEFDTTNWEQMQAHYITGNIWGYSTFLPHDVPYLLETRGGKAGLARWLDRMLADTTAMSGAAHMDISGFIGKYGHGDEPSHHIPFLYNYAGQPWKSQALVRQVLETMYDDTPDGLVNNEDYGQMSAWYLFGAMGFYPFTPGKAEYTLVSPLFDTVRLHLENGRTFTIRTRDNRPGSPYLQNARLNGQPWNSHQLPHAAVVGGGELIIDLGAEPTTDWGASDTAPYIHNPILPGFNPDPAIVRAGEDYYIATSSFEWFPGIPLYHSRDLVHWWPIGHALTRKSQADLRGIPASAGIYAPSLHYRNGRFYLVYTIVQTDERGWPLLATPNYLIHTDTIGGEWSDPVFLNSVGFDPALFFDDDGKVYLLSMVMDFRSSEPTMGKIALQQIEPETGEPLGEMRIILDVDNLWGTEGPHLYKKDGYYYLLVAQGGTFYEHAATVARSRNLWGPYELAPNTPFLTAEQDSTLRLQRAGHGSLVETQNGEWYLAHLASRALMPDRKSPLGRESNLQKMAWTADGWLRLAHGSVAPADSVPAPELPAYPFSPLPERDEFANASPRVDYQYLREMPDASWLKLVDGTLRLRGRRPPTSSYDLSLVARRITSYRTVAETALTFEPHSYRHKAGLAAYYDHRHFYWLAVSHDDSLGRCVGLLGYEKGKYREWGKAKLASQPGEAVALRFRVMGRNLQFAFREAGGNWRPIGGTQYFGNLADEQAGRSGFTGSMAALLAVDMLREDQWAAFEYFSLETNEK